MSDQAKKRLLTQFIVIYSLSFVCAFVSGMVFMSLPIGLRPLMVVLAIGAIVAETARVMKSMSKKDETRDEVVS